jgi:hypothetical protein
LANSALLSRSFIFFSFLFNAWDCYIDKPKGWKMDGLGGGGGRHSGPKGYMLCKMTCADNFIVTSNLKFSPFKVFIDM